MALARIGMAIIGVIVAATRGTEASTIALNGYNPEDAAVGNCTVRVSSSVRALMDASGASTPPRWVHEVGYDNCGKKILETGGNRYELPGKPGCYVDVGGVGKRNLGLFGVSNTTDCAAHLATFEVPGGAGKRSLSIAVLCRKDAAAGAGSARG